MVKKKLACKRQTSSVIAQTHCYFLQEIKHFFLYFPLQVNIQFTRDKHAPNNAEREDIKKLLQCMLDMSWAGNHGDHSTVCDMCNMSSIWFKLAHMLLETVFPEGGTLPEQEVLGNVAFGSLIRTNSSSKGVSSRSLCKCSCKCKVLSSVNSQYYTTFTCPLAPSRRIGPQKSITRVHCELFVRLTQLTFAYICPFTTFQWCVVQMRNQSLGNTCYDECSFNH